MGPGFESLKVHQEKRDAFLHLFFLATFVGGELLVRPIAKQWHEERSDEVVPETLLLHLFFLATFVGGELLVRPIAKQWHEERSDEVVPESALVDTNGISIRRKAPRRRRCEKYSSIVSFQANRASFVANFYPLCRSGQKMEKVGEGRGRAGSSYAFERFMILSYSVENGRQNASNFSP